VAERATDTPRLSGIAPASRRARWRCATRIGALSGGVFALFLLAFTGCTVFTVPVKTAAPASLQWLTSLASPGLDAPPPLDLTVLKPTTGPAHLDTGDLLEVTIWDIYEPGKAHTFPARISDAGTIEVPLLGEFSVRGSSTSEIEARLIESYREQELLLQPRVLVRELDRRPIKVYVTGAVNRPGVLELARDEANVYSALIAAGGLARNAGTHVLITSRAAANPAATEKTAEKPDPVDMSEASPDVQSAGDSESGHSAAGEEASSERTFQSFANPPQPVSVPPQVEETSGEAGPAAEIRATLSAEADMLRRAAAAELVSPTENEKWYDLSRERDQRLLAEVRLADGDVLTVKQTTPPVRVLGAVAHAGSYPLPAGKPVTVWEALELAGGIDVQGIPINITLTRPATEERSLQRWTISLQAGEGYPGTAPFVQPGDVIQVEPTARGQVQRVVGGLKKR